jgi:hypothetical protein
MGAQCPITRASRRRPRHLLCVRHVPSSKDSLGRTGDDIFHRCSHCTWLQQHLQAHCRPDPDWIWICNCPSGILCSERDIAKEMEAK